MGFSSTTKRYAIKSLAEAEAYLQHPVLGPRILDCISAMLTHQGVTARQILGSPDGLKLHSCATLFAHVADTSSLFQAVIDQYYSGQFDQASLRLIAADSG